MAPSKNELCICDWFVPHKRVEVEFVPFKRVGVEIVIVLMTTIIQAVIIIFAKIIIR